MMDSERKKMGKFGAVWFWSLPIAIILGIIGALLYLLYMWSGLMGGIVTVVLVWFVGCMIFSARALPKDGQDD